MPSSSKKKKELDTSDPYFVLLPEIIWDVKTGKVTRGEDFNAVTRKPKRNGNNKATPNAGKKPKKNDKGRRRK